MAIFPFKANAFIMTKKVPEYHTDFKIELGKSLIDHEIDIFLCASIICVSN